MQTHVVQNIFFEGSIHLLLHHFMWIGNCSTDNMQIHVQFFNAGKSTGNTNDSINPGMINMINTMFFFVGQEMFF